MTDRLSHASIRTLGFLLIAVMMFGCGGKDDIGKTYPVEGKVMLDKETLNEGTVTFHPDTAKGNTSRQIAVGNVNGGKFKMSTGVKEGVLPGHYKVTIHATVSSNPKDEYAVPKSIINEKFNAADRTPLTAEVKEGGGPYEYTVFK